MNLSKTLIDNDVSTCQKERRIYILVLQTASKAFTKACKQAALQKPILTSKLVKILYRIRMSYFFQVRRASSEQMSHLGFQVALATKKALVRQ